MIYVSNLPFNARDEQLRDLFKDFDVKTAYVAVRRNGRSKGFGFVNLSNQGDQQKALSAVDGKEYEGRKLTAKIAYNDERRNERGELMEQYKKQLPTKNEGPPSETVVYVSNLPWSYKDEDLKKLFADSNVKSATVAVRRNGRSKGFGFVEFATKEDQQKGLQKDQQKIEDRVITVKASVNYRGADQQHTHTSESPARTGRTGRQPGRQRESRPRGPRRDSRGGSKDRGGQRGGDKGVTVRRETAPRAENTLYISNLPFDLEDQDLKSIFNEFHAKAANVATRGGPGGRSLGFGFVEFNNAQDQKAALEALDQSEVNGRVISIKIATGGRGGGQRREGGNNRGPRRGSRGPRREGSRGRQSRGGSRDNSNNRDRPPRRPRKDPNEKKDPSPTLLYVSNLPFSVDDGALQKIFAGFKISKAYVAVRRNGRSKGFGFIDFANHEEQQKALKLNGQEFEGRQLTVQVANKVEDKPATTTNTAN